MTGSARLAFLCELDGCSLVNGEFPAIQILETSRLEEMPRNLAPVHTAPMAWLLAGIADQTGCRILSHTLINDGAGTHSPLRQTSQWMHRRPH